MATKPPTSFRLSDECRAILREIGALHGLKGAAVIEYIARRVARGELPAPPQDGRPRRRRPR